MQILNVATAVIHGCLHVAAIVLWEQCDVVSHYYWIISSST